MASKSSVPSKENSKLFPAYHRNSLRKKRWKD